MTRIALGAALALALVLAGAARAQLPPEFVDRAPAQLAADAFAGEYGELLVAEFGRILRTSANEECLRAKNIAPASLQESGRALLVRGATHMLEYHAGLFDTAKFEAALAAGAGSGAKAEYARLLRDPEVRKFIALNEPARLARIADSVVDAVDRHALQVRVRLTRRISPLASRDAMLLGAHPGEKSNEAVERFVRESKSPQVKRWLAFQDVLVEAFQASRRSDGLSRVGPKELTPDVERDLANLCVHKMSTIKP